MNFLPLALERAGFSDLAAFQRAQGLFPSGREDWQTVQALLPYLLGYRLYTVARGDTYGAIAARVGTTVRALITANPDQDPERLRIGQTLTVPLGFPVVPTDQPFTYELLQLCLDGLKARYPFLTVNAIGETAQGRKLPQVAVGVGPRRVLVNAAHHANEWITVPVVMKFLEEYARAISVNGQLYGYRAQDLYQRNVLHLVPMVNPDGVDLVTGVASPQEVAAARAISEDYPEIPFPAGWKANLRGVDLNLNYPAKWEEAKALKYELGFTTPAPRDYVGPEALSEPESRAMYQSTELLLPDLVIAWHTQGREIYWRFLDMAPAGSRELGLQMAAASGYELEDVPATASFAGYKDWFIQDYDKPGYTVEAGLGENPLPLDQLPEIVRENLPILLLGLSGGAGESAAEPQAEDIGERFG